MAAKNTRVVGRGWTWFTNYAYFSAEWTVNVEAGYEVGVGVGLKIDGTPRGGRFTVSGHQMFDTWGVGAVYVRTLSREDVCTVRVDLGEAGPITVYRDPSLLKAGWEDAKKVYKKIKD